MHSSWCMSKTLFKAGLNVNLSTDDLLQFHFIKEPLLKKYSAVAYVYLISYSIPVLMVFGKISK